MGSLPQGHRKHLVPQQRHIVLLFLGHEPGKARSAPGSLQGTSCEPLKHVG